MSEPYDLSSDAHVFVGPPFGRLTQYASLETYGLLSSATDLVDMGGGRAGERSATTVQVVRGSLGEVPYDAVIVHDGKPYRVLSTDVDGTGWFDVLQVAEAS